MTDTKRMTAGEALEILKDLVQQDLYGVNEEDYRAALSVLAGLAEENERLSRQHDQCHDRNTELIKENVALQHIMDCANTPLMADVLKERDALKAENDKLITDISHLQHDLFCADQERDALKVEVERLRHDQAEINSGATKEIVRLQQKCQQSRQLRLRRQWELKYLKRNEELTKAEAELDAAYDAYREGKEKP